MLLIFIIWRTETERRRERAGERSDSPLLQSSLFSLSGDAVAASVGGQQEERKWLLFTSEPQRLLALFLPSVSL